MLELRPKPRQLAAVGHCALLLLSCSVEGTTPDCPRLPEYDVRDAEARRAAWPALIEAQQRNCITLPDTPDSDATAFGGAPAADDGARTQHTSAGSPGDSGRGNNPGSGDRASDSPGPDNTAQ